MTTTWQAGWQCKDVPDRPILELLASLSEPATYGNGYAMATVGDAMPEGTPDKVQVAKMGQLIRRGLVDGCACGCRGDFLITDKGRELLRGAK